MKHIVVSHLRDAASREAELEGLAGLPSELTDEDQDAKQFDWLMLRLQLALLNSDGAYKRLCEQLKDAATKLSELGSIPMVAHQMALILEVQTDEFWQGVTIPILENVRRKLRSLMKLIEKSKRNQVYSDFEDQLFSPREVLLHPREHNSPHSKHSATSKVRFSIVC